MAGEADVYGSATMPDQADEPPADEVDYSGGFWNTVNEPEAEPSKRMPSR